MHSLAFILPKTTLHPQNMCYPLIVKKCGVIQGSVFGAGFYAMYIMCRDEAYKGP